MRGQIPEISVLLLLLIAATTTIVDASRAKREENSDGDLSDNLKDLVDNLGGLVGDAFETAADLANYILEQTGFDPKDLPRDLMQTAASLFQMADTSTFENMLADIQSHLGDAFSMETLKNNFNKLLHDVDFVSSAKTLLEKYGGNPNNPEYVVEMERLTETRLQAMGGAASRQWGALTMLTGLLGALLAPRVLPWG